MHYELSILRIWDISNLLATKYEVFTESYCTKHHNT